MPVLRTVSREALGPSPFSRAGAHQYQADYESGLYLLGNRYYDPSIGWFISQDPAQG
jgi:RHS repeat-associated protein